VQQKGSFRRCRVRWKRDHSTSAGKEVTAQAKCDPRLCYCVELVVDADVQSVSCSWSRTCLVSGGLCYVTDSVSSLGHCVAVHQAVSSEDAVGSCRGREHFTSVETNDTTTLAVTSERGLMSVTPDGQVDRLWTVFKVQSVSCGRCHSLVLSAIGVVFSCGLGSHGQLGHGGVESEHSLRVVEALEGLRMRQVSAGGWHSAAVSDCGDVYVWGWNEAGQLGLRRRIETVTTTSTMVTSTTSCSMVTSSATTSSTSSSDNESTGQSHVTVGRLESLVAFECSLHNRPECSKTFTRATGDRQQ